VSEQVQRFRATGGRATGILGLAVCAAAALAFATSGSPQLTVSGLIGCAFAALLVYASMLRPQVSASAEELTLRTLFETVTIPLASIDTVVVRRYLLVRSGGNKYICPAVGRSLRKTVRTELKWKGSTQVLAPGVGVGDRLGEVQTDVATHDLDYPDLVEQQITALAADDRARRGIEPRSEEEYELGSQVRRRTAWPEVVALALLGLAFVISLFV
jgi:hypothetical protein